MVGGVSRSAEPEDLVVVVDDLGVFGFNAMYLRTLGAALDWLESWSSRPTPVEELWLDHDLGGEDTVRPFVIRLEELTVVGGPLPIRTIKICSSNPVGVRYIQQALSRHYRVEQVAGAVRYRVPDPREVSGPRDE